MTIHWWRTERLVDDLSNDRISETQSLQYAIASSIMYYLGLYSATWFGGYRHLMIIIEFLVVCAIVVIGLQECFKANGGPDGCHFLKRLYCLGVPIGIKTFLIGIATSLLLQHGLTKVVTTQSFRNPYLVLQMLSFSLAGMLVVLYFWWIAYHMKRISKSELLQSVI